MTLGYVKVRFTNEDGTPIYADKADIAEEIDALNMMPGVTVAELDGEVKALGFPTDAEGKNDQGGSLRGQMERILAEDKPWGIDMVSHQTLRRKILECFSARRRSCNPTFANQPGLRNQMIQVSTLCYF